ncbi:MAG: DUF763 domain-containing protein [Pseudomonadota bacterium]
MSSRTGSANLPLHGGFVPQWLATRMATLGRVIVEAVAHEYGRDEVLVRLADPFWFQSFGAVMGMDWHSSGITTSVIGALRRGLEPVQDELGLYVCGGRGRRSRATPAELCAVGDRTGLDGEHLAGTSRLVAKVDNNALQDGYQLYLHGFIVAADGAWCVVQQGMRPEVRYARRYHWLSAGLTNFVDAPHAGLDGIPAGEILNLTDTRAALARDSQLRLLEDEGPDRIVATLADQQRAQLHLDLPAHHHPRPADVKLRRLHAALAAAAERGPKDFPDLLVTPGVGPRTIESLALVAEVVYGAPARFSDPARFSYAHGGKDGFPFPVPLDVYDRTASVLRRALTEARLGRRERLDALARLDRQSLWLEGKVDGPGFAQIVAREHERLQHMDPRQVGDRPAAAGSGPRIGSARAESGRRRKATAKRGATQSSGQLDLF